MDDSDQSLTRLGEDLKAKVLRFISRLRGCSRTHWDTNGPAIQKNISRICQDQARLQEVRCGIESLMQENDPFRFIEVGLSTQAVPQTAFLSVFINEWVFSFFQAYKTTGKQ